MRHTTHARVALTLSVLVLSSALGGCYRAHLCGEEERCNLFDDDCDGLVDEGFVSDDGVYRDVQNCGTCGIDCRGVFPTAQEVACDDAVEGPICRLVSCAPGSHLAGAGACEPDVVSLCLPCTEDGDCALRMPDARCLDTASGARRCGTPCDLATPCPTGFTCTPGTEPGTGQCTPDSGFCGCTDATMDVDLACLLHSPTDTHECAGVQHCGPMGATPCEPALTEACNHQDDDCNGNIDETFRDDMGRYVSRLACGDCAVPCVEPGPHMVATCLADPSIHCDVQCAMGFVDVNRILADGCECQRWDGMGPPPMVGGDANCDGIADDTDQFVYVTTTGSDTNPGTLAHPMRTIDAATARARSQNKDVLVARGIYPGTVHVVAGVSVYGGYAPDFTDRDLELYPVQIERPAEPGLPPLVCDHVTGASRFEGFTVAGSDAAVEGQGSTAVVLDGCGAGVVLADVTVLAGRAMDGTRGSDSSANLAMWGLMSLTQLDGVSGRDGVDSAIGSTCPSLPGGTAGVHVCRSVDVSGGAGGGAACPGNICTNGRPCGNGGCTDFTVGGVCNLDAAIAVAVANPAAGAGHGPGAGAAGDLTYNAPTDRGVCNFCDDNPTLPRTGVPGGDGTSGVDGGGGLGCPGGPTIGADGRVRGSLGGDGTAGSDGGGGGGGSAGSGYEVLAGTVAGPGDPSGCTDHSGGSGGGGGSGGCGAPGASGGGGGGYSIGVLVRLTTGMSGPTYTNVRIVTASGGEGGDGGVGADGGAAGLGARGGTGAFWCSRTGGRGGDGGNGGSGGGGGGGCGGGSHGVLISTPSGGDAYRDAVIASVTVESTGVGGAGGRGGFSPGRPGTSGVAGTAEPVALVH